MPREDRRIVFSPEDVYRAIYALSVQKQMPKPPPGAITSIVMNPDDPSKIVFHLSNPAQNTEETLDYTYDFVAAALMVYCRGVGIPLPKKAHKSVQMADGELALRVQVGD